MSAAATIAIPFFGSFEASFERRWAYSREVIPGVTAIIADQQRFRRRCLDHSYVLPL